DQAVAELELATDRAAPAWHRHLASGYRALIAVSRDDAEEIKTHLAPVRDLRFADLRDRLNANASAILRARALAAERAGRVSEAASVLAEVLDEPSASVDSTVSDVLPLLTRLALAVGDMAVAAAAETVATGAAAAAEPERMPEMTAIADHCRGLVTADPALVLAAADSYESVRGPHDRALALEDAADLLAGQGEAAAAGARLRDAIAVYQGLGAQWDIRRAEARLRARGVRRSHHPGSRGPGHATRAGWDTLTATELKVARLVANGQSNSGIAAELLISPRTVQTHVSHVLAKLGARSRGEIAREARSASSETASSETPQ
ncbi:MAG: helix-turn-helix transcriptional regulator, partial [Trebonia sp.]